MTNLVDPPDKLAWPITVMTIVVLLRRELRDVFSRLSHLKYGELEATFEKGLQEAEARAKAAALPMAGSQPAPASREAELVAEERLSRLTEISPRAAISEAWIGVEEALRAVASILDLDGRDRMSHRRIVQELRRLGRLNDDVLATYDRLRRLRNEAVHAPDFALSSKETNRYVELATGLAAYLPFQNRDQDRK